VIADGPAIEDVAEPGLGLQLKTTDAERYRRT
jgi:hypothetical protein